MQHISHVCRRLRHGTRLSVDHSKFYKLSDQASDISAHSIRFEGCGDIHPMKFPNATNTRILWFEACDKNFTYYWLDPHIFPQLQYCILNTRIVADLYRFLPHVFPQTTFFMYEAEFRSRHMIPCDQYIRMLDADLTELQKAWQDTDLQR